jgi:D-alanine-D-alanine ligase
MPLGYPITEMLVRRSLSIMKIALVYDLNAMAVSGTSSDAEDPWLEGDAATVLAAAHLDLAADHDVVLVGNDGDMEDRLLAFWPDMVINLTEAFANTEQESSLAALLERWHLPYSGSSVDTLRRCYDKGTCRRELRKKGMPTPVFMVVQTPEDVRGVERFPLLVKPLVDDNPADAETEGVVHTPSALLTRVRWILETYEQPALVETALPGKKYTVALLGNGANVAALPLVEWDIVPLPAETVAVAAVEELRSWPRGAASRYKHRCPAQLAPDHAQTLVALAQQAFVALDCRDVCDVLLRLDADGQPYILDVNPQPRLLPHPENPSAFLSAATVAGMTYPDLIRHLCLLACHRYGLT